VEGPKPSTPSLFVPLAFSAFVAPLQGCLGRVAVFAGRCPGPSCFAPLGRRCVPERILPTDGTDSTDGSPSVPVNGFAFPSVPPVREAPEEDRGVCSSGARSAIQPQTASIRVIRAIRGHKRFPRSLPWSSPFRPVGARCVFRVVVGGMRGAAVRPGALCRHPLRGLFVLGRRTWGSFVPHFAPGFMPSPASRVGACIPFLQQRLHHRGNCLYLIAMPGIEGAMVERK
jgi:hypothetical protein